MVPVSRKMYCRFCSFSSFSPNWVKMRQQLSHYTERDRLYQTLPFTRWRQCETQTSISLPVRAPLSSHRISWEVVTRDLPPKRVSLEVSYGSPFLIALGLRVEGWGLSASGSALQAGPLFPVLKRSIMWAGDAFREPSYFPNTYTPDVTEERKWAASDGRHGTQNCIYLFFKE